MRAGERRRPARSGRRGPGARRRSPPARRPRTRPRPRAARRTPAPGRSSTHMPPRAARPRGPRAGRPRSSGPTGCGRSSRPRRTSPAPRCRARGRRRSPAPGSCPSRAPARAPPVGRERGDAASNRTWSLPLPVQPWATAVGAVLAGDAHEPARDQRPRERGHERVAALVERARLQHREDELGGELVPRVHDDDVARPGRTRTPLDLLGRRCPGRRRRAAPRPRRRTRRRASAAPPTCRDLPNMRARSSQPRFRPSWVKRSWPAAPSGRAAGSPPRPTRPSSPPRARPP